MPILMIPQFNEEVPRESEVEIFCFIVHDEKGDHERTQKVECFTEPKVLFSTDHLYEGMN